MNRPGAVQPGYGLDEVVEATCFDSAAVLCVYQQYGQRTGALGLDSNIALIAAYSYGLNMMSDSSAGLALLESIRSRGCEILSRTGNGHDLAKLFAHPRTHFWGDLDREGLRIAHALQQHIPQLELSGLYLPMRAMVDRDESSHPYVMLSGKALQAPWTRTGNDQLDELAAVCDTRAVD